MKAVLVTVLCSMVRVVFWCVGYGGVFFFVKFRFWREMLERVILSFVLVESVEKTDNLIVATCKAY